MNEDTAAGTSSCCASCGIAEVDELNLLKECTSCDLVRYCSDACLKDHKSQHEQACKKRAAELRDELLFKQPESTHRGDCPICMIPMPLDLSKSIIMTCCSKVICKGCDYANRIREEEASVENKCPFCRQPVPKTNDGRSRVEANDPVAMRYQGREQYNKGDYSSAFEYLMKAAKLGELEAHYSVSCMYQDGLGVEKDRGKSLHHLEEAAIGGHPEARCNLGCEEWNDGHTERAVKHYIIAANLGNDPAIKYLMEDFKDGFVSKDDLAAALRAHQAAVDATKSPQREVAKIAGI